jgi:uncharacterized membrane protein YfhO
MDQLGSVQLLKYSPNELLLKVSTSRPAVLVATETFWPEWHAAIDGSKTHLCRIDGLFRGLMVPVGTHEVRMFVRPRSVYEAGILFALGILALCFCALRPKRFPAPVGDLDAGHRF